MRHRQVLSPLQEQKIKYFSTGTVEEIGIFLMLSCGLRQGEMLGLCAGDIDFARHVLTVRHSHKRERNVCGEMVDIIRPYTKTGEHREVPVSFETEALLRRLIRETGAAGPESPIMIRNGKILSSYYLHKRMKEWLGLSDSRIFRRSNSKSYIMKFPETGLMIARKIEGHSNARTTQQYYSAISGNDTRKVSDTIGNAYYERAKDFLR